MIYWNNAAINVFINLYVTYLEYYKQNSSDSSDNQVPTEIASASSCCDGILLHFVKSPLLP